MYSCIILSVLYLIQWTNANFVIPNDDPNAAEKYTVNYISEFQWDSLYGQGISLELNGTFFTFGDNDTRCFIPNYDISDDEEQLDKDSEEFIDIISNTLDEAAQVISSKLDGYCVIYQNGFWTYTYCPGRDLIQVHNETRDPQVLSYTLGRAKANIKERKFQLQYNDFGYYVNEVIGMGDICDLTGSPRLVDIQYICEETHLFPTIKWIRETKICQYEAQVTLPELCNIELLGKTDDKKVASTIDCVKQGEDKNIIDLISDFNPIFLSHNIYLLKTTEEGKRDRLVYSQNFNFTALSDLQGSIYRNFGSAMSRILTQKLLISPEGFIVTHGDAFIWISDLLDIQGNMICKVSFDVGTDGKAVILFDKDLEFTTPSNFETFKNRNGNLGDIFLQEEVDENKKDLEDETTPNVGDSIITETDENTYKDENLEMVPISEDVNHEHPSATEDESISEGEHHEEVLVSEKESTDDEALESIKDNPVRSISLIRSIHTLNEHEHDEL